MNLTTEIRIKDSEAIECFESYLKEESTILLFAIRELQKPNFKEIYKSESKFNTYLCKKFDILGRKANSIIYRAKAIIKSRIEFIKWEISDKSERLESLDKELAKKLKSRDILKKKAAENKLSKRGLKQLKKIRERVYFLYRKRNKLNQKIKTLKKDLKLGRLRIALGGKKLFKAQFNLKANGYKNHEEWKKDYQDKKCTQLYYIGRANERGGNQLCSLFINKENGTLSLRYRKEHVKKKEEKYLWVHNLVLHYLKNEVYSILNNPGSKPITIRLLKRGRKWYLQIMFEMTEPPVVTDTKNGVISIDFNNGFLQQGELDKSANLVGLKKRILKYHGSGNRALNEMREQVKEIVEEAGLKLKSIAREELDFELKKQGLNRRGSKRNRQYNKMVSTLDYRRFSEELTRCAAKNGVEVIAVPAYNTSRIAAEKYCPGRCLTVHQGSTITIGRRAMGLKN